MTEREINQKLRQAYSHAAPDHLDAVLFDCRDEQKGNVVKMTTTKNKTWTTKLIAAAACLCLLVGGAIGLQSYRVNHTVDAVVSLDVNPSVEIQVNKKDRVMAVNPLNEDGRTIVGEMDFSGSSLEVAVNALIGSMLQNGYLNELANSILISVDNDDPVRGAALQQRLTEEVNKLLQTDTFTGAVLSQTVSKDEELRQMAEQYGITQGKAQLIREIMAGNALHTFAELAPLTINELNLLLRAEAAAPTHVEITGTASDKAYIGEAKAKEIALQKAGVSADGLVKYEIELDTENGMMIYDVEFTAGSYEYDCEINAKTGAVVKFEKETRDGYTASSVGNVSISVEKAKGIALARALLSAGEIAQLEIELDTEDGMAVYEIEFKAKGYEYSMEINAATGAILKFEKETDD